MFVKRIIPDIDRLNGKQSVVYRDVYKRQPFYRIVVADARAPRDGKFIEEIGTYDPNQNPSVFKVDEEAAKKWLNNGAQPTEVVGKIFKAAGIEK